MQLDGLRAWIGEVERKLGKRTRVFLALTALAIGIAGAAIYLALDARSDSVSEGDVQELQQELEAQGVGTTGGAELSRLEAEVRSLQAEVERLKGNGGASDQGKGGSSQDRSGDNDGSGGASGSASGEGGGPDSGSSGASGGVVPEKGDPARLQELLERAKEQSEANG